jgi:hypothetical protein
MDCLCRGCLHNTAGEVHGAVLYFSSGREKNDFEFRVESFTSLTMHFPNSKLVWEESHSGSSTLILQSSFYIQFISMAASTQALITLVSPSPQLAYLSSLSSLNIKDISLLINTFISNKFIKLKYYLFILFNKIFFKAVLKQSLSNS